MEVSHKSMEIFVREKENVIFCNPHSPEINACFRKKKSAGQVFSADSYNFKRKACREGRDLGRALCKARRKSSETCFGIKN